MNLLNFMSKKLLILFSVASILLVGCSKEPKKVGMPALFETEEEAKQAAKDFNCRGAHKMGTKWMPCEKHGHHHH